jgi:hypothetical protein
MKVFSSGNDCIHSPTHDLPCRIDYPNLSSHDIEKTLLFLFRIDHASKWVLTGAELYF